MRHEMTSLSGERAYLDKVTEKDVYDEGSLEPFLPKQRPPIAFIYLPPSEQSSDNPYATQPAYNPSYKSTLNDTTGRDGITENNEGNEIRDEENCVTYCIIGIVILVIVSVIIGIIYFLIQHPKFARAMYNAIEADTTDGNATSVKKITAVANQLGRMANKTSTMTIEPSKIHEDND
ncbi:uncharacterized protein LOC116850053 isoform X3 [Odontomachus brunneus]|uniref:uncharacterized protein LOC116850053 isoform X3 n=1 Tax=Odontomachus brunneus TaxID=486640 RepID=UPI0013F18F8D|nr:uncharacterized protein LOC116850053 isoform X3 [Odontomachus brunneus]